MPKIKYFILLIILIFVFFAKLIIPTMVEAAAWVLSSTRWTDQDEKAYQQFVEAVGNSGYGNLNKFIKDPTKNPFYGEEDKKFNLSPDCADLPYLLRAYVAYKLRLPFSYVSAISGKGGDQRYSSGNRPTQIRDINYFSSPQQLFSQLTLVNSGYYRMAPEVQESDTYPVKIDKRSIVPGTIFYDPNGHVAVVYQVTDDGRIRLIDAHPDRSISRPWFGSKFVISGPKQGGGFRRWRPVWFSSDGKTLKLPNINIPDFSATDQYQKNYQLPNGQTVGYHEYVKIKLSKNDGKIEPIKELQQMMLEIFEDIQYRAEAVEICIKAGIHRKPHPGALPWNIYGTDGEWEIYSTPSRDARLKVAFVEMYSRVQEIIRMAETGDSRLIYHGNPKQLAMDLIQTYDSLSPKLSITYINSNGQPVKLSFHDVVKRLFDLSFDPYHSIELRWGARDAELQSAKDDPVKQRFYVLERRLRNQLERVYNCPTGFNLGPENPVDVNIRDWLLAYVAGQAIALPNTVAEKQIFNKTNEITALTSTQIASINNQALTLNSSATTNRNVESQDQFARKFFSKVNYLSTNLFAWINKTIK